MRRYALQIVVLLLVTAGLAWPASVAIRNLTTATNAYDSDKLPIGRATNPDALAVTVRQLRQPFYNYTTRLRTIPMPGANYRFGNLSASRLYVEAITMPQTDDGNSVELYQPLSHGGNTVTFKPYSTLAAPLTVWFANDGIYANISGGSRSRRVVAW